MNVTKLLVLIILATVGCVVVAQQWGPRSTADVPSTRPSQASVMPQLVTGGKASTSETPSDSSLCKITTGKWEQITEAEENGYPILTVTEEGKGQIVLSFSGVTEVLVGAEKVVIDTTWTVDGEDVTFMFTNGTPRSAYERCLTFSIDEVTKFHVEKCESDTLVLKRAKDDKVFQWSRLEGQAEVTPAALKE